MEESRLRKPQRHASSASAAASADSALATAQSLDALVLSNLASQSGTGCPAALAILTSAGAHSLS